jgi:hypothetical protein
MRIFNSIHKKSLSLLHGMDHELNLLFGSISIWVTDADTYTTFPTLNIKRLHRLSDMWVKNKDAMEHIFTTLSPLVKSDGDHPPLETRL